MRGIISTIKSYWGNQRVRDLVVLGLFSILITLPMFHSPIARANDKRVVTLHIGEETVSFPTDAETVAQALERRGVVLAEQDLVEPSPDTAITGDIFHINVYRARPVLVIDGDQRTTVVSAYQSPRLIAQQAGLEVYDEDILNLSRVEDFLGDGLIGLKLEINRATPLKLNLYGTTETIRTQASTVSELLLERGLEPDENDVVRPKGDTAVKSGMEVFLVRVSGDREVVEETLAFTRREIRDTSQPLGYEKVTKAGRNGSALVTYELSYENGVEVSRKEVSRVVVEPAVDEVVIVGADYRGSYPNNAAILAALRMCETTNNYAANTGNGFYGAYQFMIDTWNRTAQRMGQMQWYGVLPSSAPPSVQDAFVLDNARASSGGFWSQHPGCSKKLDLPQFPY